MSVGGLGNSFEEYVAALKKREELNASLSAAEQKVTMLDQLVTYLSVHISNPSQNQQLKILREAASKALLGVASVVNNYVTIIIYQEHRSKRYKQQRISSRKSSSREMGPIFSPSLRALTNSLSRGKPTMVDHLWAITSTNF